MKTKIGFAMLLALSACNQNPYSEVTNSFGVTPDATPVPTTPLLRVVVPQVFECLEGGECKIPLEANVKEPGTPILKFEGLPDGAKYDPSDRAIHFSPGYDFVNRNQDISLSIRSLTIRVLLKNSLDPVTTYEKLFTLNVKDVERPMKVTTENATFLATEGKTLTEKITVQSEDYTKDFAFRVVSPVDGVIVTRVANTNQFTLTYTPSAFAVSAQTATTDPDRVYAANFFLKGEFIAPSGTVVPWEQKIRVRDVRLDPVVTAPETVSIGMMGEFSIIASDPNGERAPKIILPSSVDIGRVRVEETISSAGNISTLPTRIYRVIWDRIPNTAAGQSLDYSYSVCGPTDRRTDTVCSVKTVKVNFTAIDQGPMVSRGEWPKDKVYFVRAGETLTKKLPVVDRVDANNLVQVEIYPEEYRSEIQWQNGTIAVSPKVEGKRLFQVVAKSIYNQVTLETFVVDVLPANWGTSAILVGSNADADASALAQQLSSADLVSADQGLNERSLALRKRVVLTTDFFRSSNAGDALKLINGLSIPVVVSSPALDQNSTDFWAAMSASYQLSMKGRLAQLAPANPDPSAYIFGATVASKLPEPSVPAGLAGKLTSESGSPACLQIADPASCTSIFTLNRPGFSCVVGVRCQKTGQQPMTVLGFEWSDLVMDSSDAAIHTQWQQSVFNLK